MTEVAFKTILFTLAVLAAVGAVATLPIIVVSVVNTRPGKILRKGIRSTVPQVDFIVDFAAAVIAGSWWPQRWRWTLSIVGLAAFIAGYAIAVIGGVWWPGNVPLIATLVILGIIVGFLSLPGREVIPYLIAAIALVLVGNMQFLSPLHPALRGLGGTVNDVLLMMAIFVAAGLVVHSIRSGLALATTEATVE